MAKRIKLPGRAESAEVGGVVAGANTIYDDAKGKMQDVVNSEVDAELVRLNESKQDNLTFDNAPTEGSQNPVTSGGVYTADKALSDAIEAILLLIPSAASALNQLADKSFVNSSIATATATFRGTYNLVSDLHLTVNATHEQIAAALDVLLIGADNNDYLFVQIPTSDTAPTEISKTERYKFNGTAWSFEYDLNNSGFTAAQWAAINSGITSVLVHKLGALPTNAELVAALAGKQNVLTFDNAPTAGSQNPVKSAGIYARNNEIVAMINALDEAKQDVLTFDSTPINGSTNPVTSNGVYLAISLVQAAVVALDGRMGTAETKIGNAETNIVNLQAAYAALTQSDIVVVEGPLPSTGQQQNVIYRQPDQDHTPPQFYSDYMWNGTAWVLMATYDNAIDDVPTLNSNNLVKSGGVYKSLSSNITLIMDSPTIVENYFTDIDDLEFSYVVGIMRTDGTIENLSMYKTYTIINDRTGNQWRYFAVYSPEFDNLKGVTDDFACFELSDDSGNIIFRGNIQGCKAILVKQGWTLRLSKHNDITVKIQTNSGYPFIDPALVKNSIDKEKLVRDRDYIREIYYFNPSNPIQTESDFTYKSGVYEFGADPEGNPSYESDNYKTYKLEPTSNVVCIFNTPGAGRPAFFRYFCSTFNGDITCEKSLENQKTFMVRLSQGFIYYIFAQNIYIFSDGYNKFSIDDPKYNFQYTIQQVPFVSNSIKNTIIPLETTRGGYMFLGDTTIPSGDIVDYVNYTNTTNQDINIICNYRLGIGRSNQFKNITILDPSGKIKYEGTLSEYGNYVIRLPYTYQIILALPRKSDLFCGIINETNLSNLITQIHDNIIYGIGDSLTAGNQYLNKVQDLILQNENIKIATVNFGIGGEGVGTIFGRVNSIPYKVKNNITIPTGTTAINIELKNDYGSWLLPLLQGDSNQALCIISGIVGTLSTNNSPADTSATYTFTRSTAGRSKVIKAGEEILFECSGRYGGVVPGANQIIFVGQNGGYKAGGDTARYQPSAPNITQEDADNLMDMIKNHILCTRPSKFLVLSPPVNTNAILESTFLNNFHGSFINVRERMVNDGIDIALEKGYLVGDYPTSQDQADIAEGKVPTSLRADNVHFNTAGYNVLGEIIYDKVRTQWNISGRSY